MCTQLLKSSKKCMCLQMWVRSMLFLQGKETGDQSCQFKAILSESESKRYVCLESKKYQGWYLSMKEDGRKFGPSDAEAKFRVRVEVW